MAKYHLSAECMCGFSPEKDASGFYVCKEGCGEYKPCSPTDLFTRNRMDRRVGATHLYWDVCRLCCFHEYFHVGGQCLLSTNRFCANA
jgi:hypothetical protein